MIRDIQIRLDAKDASSSSAIRATAIRKAGLAASDVNACIVRRRSVDARRRPVMVDLSVRLYVGQEPEAQPWTDVSFPDVGGADPVVVVGAGPAGLFAALQLICEGRRPIVLERGADVHQRKRDIAAMCRTGVVNADSNYSFGEGGAGAFSDGKLYTRSTKRGDVQAVLSLLCQHGASPDILVDAHPHIGTDKLPQVIERMRNTIVQSGGQVLFGHTVQSLVVEEGTVTGAVANGVTFHGPVVLATGHSARDVYGYLAKSGIALEQKGLALGVRIEHPQHLIDTIQYHDPAGRGQYLPAAEYSFVTQVDGRGVYSFCMCPGGIIIPAATANGEVVVNGMSSAARNSRWANSGMVVEVRPEDLPSAFERFGVLGMMHLQMAIERRCALAGGGKLVAPAQRMTDFIQGKISSTLPESSYIPGVVSYDLAQVLPPMVHRRLREGLRVFGANARGFLTDEALLVAAETRTSSPVRIPRNTETMQHVALKGLYPCGEGAGYAGGIVSAALDGIACAKAVVL